MNIKKYTQAEARKKIKESGIIAIIRGEFTPDEVIAIAEVLVKHGITAISVPSIVRTPVT